jgi:hypothetical protein
MSDAPDLAPADAAVALRSLPRRFREAIALSTTHEEPTPDDDDRTAPSTDAIEAHAQQLGPDGTSPLEQVVATTAELSLLHRATTALLAGSAAPLHPAVVDRTARVWDVPPGLTLDDAMIQLEQEATSYAHLLETADATAWAKEGAVAGGHSVTALGLVSDAVHSAVARLRSIR